MRRRVGAIFAGIALLISASSCIIWSTDQLGVSAGVGLYVYIYKVPTDDIEALHIWKQTDAKTLAFMDKQIVFSDGVKGLILNAGYHAADIDYFFDQENADDFGESLDQVRNTSKCLLMHRNPALRGGVWGGVS